MLAIKAPWSPNRGLHHYYSPSQFCPDNFWALISYVPNQKIGILSKFHFDSFNRAPARAIWKFQTRFSRVFWSKKFFGLGVNINPMGVPEVHIKNGDHSSNPLEMAELLYHCSLNPWSSFWFCRIDFKVPKFCENKVRLLNLIEHPVLQSRLFWGFFGANLKKCIF